ncbi:hypothetical protein PP178_08510 [Zeaxanthinibacter sp. PT1]|uniref:hypothetical protein n=1 Tax=Zeaxanthinibacter TaxID=561554 RepID=UPI00234A0DFB|nr:hypothetical protein [Zeaxanthinibacter sp. PT1]MDC6351596.1 hypothetical protein [Zeaxanthinibacter sp. PT1]
MKRILIDYKRLPHEVAVLLIEAYPDGYGDDDIIAFQTAGGEYIEAVELRTGDILYLVKISKSFSHFIANFDASIEEELSNKKVKDSVAPVDEEFSENIRELELNLDHEGEEDPEEEL